MKLACYNIMSGGFNGYDMAASTPQRLTNLQLAVKEIDADIIGLVDTFRWDEVFRPKDLQKLFGYVHTISIKLNDERLQKLGHDNGLTILSNIEFRSHQTLRLVNRNALKVQIRQAGKDISLYLVYLDDLSETTRLAQTKALLERVGADEHIIIMGDLNTFAESRQNAKVVQFYAQNPTLQAKFEPVLADMSRAEVVGELTNRGLVDAGKNAGPTAPTKLFPAKVGDPFLRIDYCLHSPTLQSNKVEVMRGELYDHTSDHFPLRLTIR